MGEHKMSFEEEVMRRVERGVLKQLSSGDWLNIPYGERPTLPGSVLRDAFAAVNMSRVIEHVTHKLEERLADKMLHVMATEISNDVKQIMCDKEKREALRAVIRSTLHSMVPQEDHRR